MNIIVKNHGKPKRTRNYSLVNAGEEAFRTIGYVDKFRKNYDRIFRKTNPSRRGRVMNAYEF